jgi:hypothetical protein
MLTFKIKLIKLFKNESLARARKRIRKALKIEADRLIYSNVFKDGMSGYLRDRNYNG